MNVFSGLEFVVKRHWNSRIGTRVAKALFQNADQHHKGRTTHHARDSIPPQHYRMRIARSASCTEERTLLRSTETAGYDRLRTALSKQPHDDARGRQPGRMILRAVKCRRSSSAFLSPIPAQRATDQPAKVIRYQATPPRLNITYGTTS